MDFVSFNVIIDDVVFPDNRIIHNQLGGGGPQSVWGMRLWANSVGLVGAVGEDFPAAAWQWLQECGIDSAGLRKVKYPTLRARQEVQLNGSSRHVWLADPLAMKEMLERKIDYLPEAYTKARGFHFGLHALEPQVEFQRGLRALGAVVSAELFRPAERFLNENEMTALIGAADILSLNIIEARSLFGDQISPLDMARALMKWMPEDGAGIVALRMGGEGSLVAQRGISQAVRIPAVDVMVVDPVGAGNAYCGAFLTGWLQTGDMIEAGLMGSVAASFMLEQHGCPPKLDTNTRFQAAKRLAIARKDISII